MRFEKELIAAAMGDLRHWAADSAAEAADVGAGRTPPARVRDLGPSAGAAPRPFTGVRDLRQLLQVRAGLRGCGDAVGGCVRCAF